MFFLSTIRYGEGNEETSREIRCTGVVKRKERQFDSDINRRNGFQVFCGQDVDNPLFALAVTAVAGK